MRPDDDGEDDDNNNNNNSNSNGPQSLARFLPPESSHVLLSHQHENVNRDDADNDNKNMNITDKEEEEAPAAKAALLSPDNVTTTEPKSLLLQMLPCSQRQRRRRFLMPSATSRSLSFGKQEEEKEGEETIETVGDDDCSQSVIGSSSMTSTNNIRNPGKKRPRELQVTSLLFSSPSKDGSSTVIPTVAAAATTTTTTTRTSRSSLFGNVMQRTRHVVAAGYEFDNYNSNNNNNSSNHVSHQFNDNNNNNNMHTPNRHLPQSTSPSGKEGPSSREAQQQQAQQQQQRLHLSPGGFSLMNLLKSANSPFAQQKKNKIKNSILTTTTRTTKMTATTAITSSNQDDDDDDDSSQDNDDDSNTAAAMLDWDEADCSKERDFVNVMDWSLKSRLRFEACPSSALMSLPKLVQGQGLQQFMSLPHTTATTSADKPQTTTNLTMEECDAKWESCLLYWQYPSNILRPRDDHANQKRLRRQASLGQKERENSQPPLKDLDATKQRQDPSFLLPSGSKKQNPVHKSAAINNLDSIFTTTPMSKEQREWQEAFWSLSRKWQHAVDQIMSKQHSPSTTTMTWTNTTMELLASSYFYAMGCSHPTVLFRMVIESSNGNFTPMIVLSSTTRTIRDKLKSMNIKLWCLRGDDATKGKRGQEEEYRENDEENNKYQRQSSSRMKSTQNADSPLVKKELELLRKAQASGETVGANVSFKWNYNKANNGNRSSRTSHHPPLYITGMDDCMAFCEVYLNTIGFSYYNNNNDNRNDDDYGARTMSLLPLLYCRRLGPFLHSNLKTLQVSSKRLRNNATATAASSVHNSINNNNNNNNPMDVLEIGGTILPCAYNEMLRCAIHRMMLEHENASAEGDGGLSSTASPHHHLVMYSKPLEDDDLMVQAPPPNSQGSVATTTRRSSSSVLLNAGMGSKKSSTTTTTTTTTTTNNNDEHSTELVMVKECGHGHAISAAVWDAARQDAFAFKTENCYYYECH